MDDMTFVGPEGVYTNVEEIKPSPFIVTATPRVRLSSIVVHHPISKSSNTLPHWQLLGGGNKDKEKDGRREKDEGSMSSSDKLAGTDEDGHAPDTPSPVLQPQSPTFDPLSSKTNSRSASTAGKKKPKNNIRTTTSSFVTRMQCIENLNKIIHNKQGDVAYLFYNYAKNFFWTEVGVKAKEPLARISFSAFPTCHDVNKVTASPSNLDVVIGFSTGDLIWFEPISGRYVRLNKQCCISNSPCTAVRWVPGSPSLFLVSHADGTLILFDKEREDEAFVPRDPFQRNGVSSGHGHNYTGTATGTSNSSSSPSEASSQGEWDPLESIFVTTPKWHRSAAYTNHNRGKSEKDKIAKNPVGHWRVSKRGIVDFAYSSDARLVAAISEDGCLRIIDAYQECLVDCFASYFGSFTCVDFSEDGKFVITGGQDDLVTVFSMSEGRVIARCQGHSSFISSVSFDAFRSDKRTYRFGSVGEDNKIILWDFSAGVLHRPKVQAAHQQRISMSSTLSLALRRRGDGAEGSTLHLPPNTHIGEDVSKYHPAPSRNEVAIVQPVLTKHIDGDLLTDVLFIPSGVLTASKQGTSKLWVRPLALRPRTNKARLRAAAFHQDEL